MRRCCYVLLAILGLLGAAVVGANAGAAASTPATVAAGNPCVDITIANPTPVHDFPSDSAGVLKTVPKGYTVRGDCTYANNSKYGHWFMEVAMAGGGYGYIWVQRLQWGEEHYCDYNGTLYRIPTARCRLLPVD